MISHLGSGQALVPEAPVPAWATWSSGGPVSHGSGYPPGHIENHYVYPGGGDANAYEGEAGALWTGKPYGFTPNGYVFLGGDASVSSGSAMPPIRMSLTTSIGPTV